MARISCSNYGLTAKPGVCVCVRERERERERERDFMLNDVLELQEPAKLNRSKE